MKKDDDLDKCFWVVEYLHPLNLQVLIESYSGRQEVKERVGLRKKAPAESKHLNFFTMALQYFNK